jgi:hypothetical protein
VDPEVKLVHHSNSVLMGEMASSQPAIYSIQFMSASRPILNILNLNLAVEWEDSNLVDSKVQSYLIRQISKLYSVLGLSMQ